MVYINTCKESGVIKRLNKLIDNKDGKILKKNPKCLRSGECGEVEI
jgi:translation elongation factor EF-1alpha